MTNGKDKKDKTANKEHKEEKHSEKKIGITVKKSENFSEWYTQVCSEQGADLVDVRYGVAGFVVHKPWAFKMSHDLKELLQTSSAKSPVLWASVIVPGRIS